MGSAHCSALPMLASALALIPPLPWLWPRSAPLKTSLEFASGSESAWKKGYPTVMPQMPHPNFATVSTTIATGMQMSLTS